MEENKTMYCINCSASNCIHHTAQDKCDAGSISVGCETACTSNETCCDTFKPKEY